MVLTIKISDELYAKYAEQDKQNPRNAIEKQLERFQDFSVHDRVLVFTSPARRRLEKLTGLPIENVEKFVDWVQSLVSFKVNDVQVPLRAGQLRRLQTDAKFFKRDLPAYIADKARTALDAYFGPY